MSRRCHVLAKDCDRTHCGTMHCEARCDMLRLREIVSKVSGQAERDEAHELLDKLYHGS